MPGIFDQYLPEKDIPYGGGEERFTLRRSPEDVKRLNRAVFPFDE